jgi:hypothetical protein
MKRNLSRHAPALLLLAFALLATIYSIVVPPFEAPDEIWHMAFVQHVAAGKGLPIATPNTQELWRQQGTQAPLYYLGAAALTFWIDQSDFPALYARSNPHARIGVPGAEENRNYQIHYRAEGWRGGLLALQITRLWSVALGVLTVWSIYRTLLALFSRRLALLGAAAVAFLPQFLFLSGAASNDNATTAFIALTLWRLVDLVKPRQDGREPSLRDFAFLGAAVGLALGSKLSAGPIVLPVALGVTLVAWRARSLRLFIRGALATSLPALAVGGWWFIRNWILYRDLLAWNMWQANILRRIVPAGWDVIASELVSLERSFWGLFGWLNVPYPGWVYAAFRAGEVFLLVGLILAVVLVILRRRPDWRWAAAALILLWSALLTVSWLRFMREVPAAQGRYFFPGLPAFALLVALAQRGWLALAGGSRAASNALVAPTAALALLAVATPFWIIAPAYAVPASRVELAPQLTPVSVRLGDEMLMTGVSGQSGAFEPGGVGEITVAWQALRPPAADYSVFVHLVNDAGMIIAQADTMPGDGNYPTTQWREGETRVETYRVRIPATAYAPDAGHWVVGLYEARGGKRLAAAADETRDDMRLEDSGLAFGRVEVIRPAGDVPNAVNIDLTDNVTLEGYEFNARLLRPGDPLTVTLYWRARGPVSRPYTSFAHLLDRDFNTRGGHDAPPQPSTEAWPVGGLITDVHQFQVAPDAPPGIYQVEVGLYSTPEMSRLPLVVGPGAEGADRVLLGPLRVVAP